MVISQVGHLISGWVPLIRSHIKDQVHNNISICTEAATIIITIICSNWRRLVYISEGLPVPGEAEQSWRRPGIWFVGILFPSIMSTLAGLFRWSSHKCRLIKRVTITDSPKSVIGNFPAQSSPLWQSAKRRIFPATRTAVFLKLNSYGTAINQLLQSANERACSCHPSFWLMDIQSTVDHAGSSALYCPGMLQLMPCI